MVSDVMNARIILLAVAFFIVGGCDNKVAKLKFGSVTTIEVHGSDFKSLRTLNKPDEVSEFLTVLESARVVGDHSGPHPWTHRFSIGSGSWLYDASTGEFTLLSMRKTPLYKLAEEDRDRLEGFLVQGGETRLNASAIQTH